MSCEECGPFWQSLQGSLNSFLKELHVKYWVTTITMHAEIDNDSAHLNNEICADNTRRVCDARGNRVGVVFHALAFVPALVLVAF